MNKAKISLISYSLPSTLAMILVAIILFSANAPGFACAVLFLAIPYILFRAWFIALTHKVEIVGNGLEFRTGILNRTTTTLRLRQIESIDLHQGLLGRLLNYGALKFSGTGEDKDFTPYIQNPEEFKQAVQERLDSIQA